MHRSARVVPVLLLAGLVTAALSGCGGGSDDSAPKPSTPAATPTPAKAVPAPSADDCYTLTFAQAVAPTTQARPRGCRRPHTTETYVVGRLDNVVDGHLLAVDSAQVQQQVASSCTKPLAGYLGGTVDSLRLSMIRPVWFTPTVQASEQGANWYRCDVIAVAGKDRLMAVKGRLKGVLGDDHTRDVYAMCSTAKPGSTGFARVPCSERHTWKAIATVDLSPGKYPGEKAAEDASATPCRDAARKIASDALNYQWGHEWPTREQWNGGQTYDICWAPD